MIRSHPPLSSQPPNRRRKRSPSASPARAASTFASGIVNLLLTLVTLGIYHPFAKVRRLRYFHGNTLVDGQALGFHGEPWKLLRGYALVAVLALPYGAAGSVSPLSGALAALLLAALWPALWHAWLPSGSPTPAGAGCASHSPAASAAPTARCCRC